MTKAYVFSLDAMFAVVILAIFAITFSYLSVQAEEDPYSILVLEKQADDALIVLDKTGALATLNSTFINSSLDSIFPSSLSWNMDVEYYNYSSGFELEGNFSIGTDYSEIVKIVRTQREFLVFENNNVKYYAIARLRLWAE